MVSNRSGISALSTIHRFHRVGFQTHFAKPCTKSESEFFRKWTRTSDDDDRGEKTEIAWPRFITKECELGGMIGDGMVMERVKEHQPDPMIYGYRMSRNASTMHEPTYPTPCSFPQCEVHWISMRILLVFRKGEKEPSLTVKRCALCDITLFLSARLSDPADASFPFPAAAPSSVSVSVSQSNDVTSHTFANQDWKL